MKKISKRVLSLLMSVMMVVTMLPTYAITASATDTLSGYAQFLTSSSDTQGITVSGGATWNSTENAMEFDGTDDYITINSNPLSNVTATGGFAVSFDVKASETVSAGGLVLYAAKDDGNYFAVNGYDDNAWRQFSPIYDYGSKAGTTSSEVAGLWTADFHNTGYYQSGGTDLNYSSGAWCNITVEVNPNGYIKYYKNGTLIAQTLSTYHDGTINLGKGISIDNINSMASQFSTFTIGHGTPNAYDNSSDYGSRGGFGGYFKGYIKNVKFISDVTSNLYSLTTAITKYETKMNGTVYTNMATAYKAYVDANEALDSYLYGGSTGKTNAQVADATQNLIVATNNMAPWSAYTGTASVKLANDTAGSAYYNKVLYASGTTNFSGETSCGYLRFKSYVPKLVVMYYDGVNSTGYPCFPAGYEGKYKSKKEKRSTDWCYIADGSYTDSSNHSDSNFAFAGRWVGYADNAWDNSLGGVYWSSYGTTSYFGGTYNDANTLTFTSTNSWFFVNKLQYIGTGSYNNSANIYYHIYNSERGTYVGVQANVARYVVDYSQLTSAMSTKSSYLANVANYKEGGLLDLLNAYDEATAFDITKYRAGATAGKYNTTGTETTVTDSNAAAYYDYAQTACTYYAAGLNAENPTADSAANYIALRDAMDYSGLPRDLQDGGSLHGRTINVRQLIADNGVVDGYTLTGFESLRGRYNEAVAIMAELGTSGYNTNQTSNYTRGSDAATAKTNLMNAFNELSLVQVSAPTVTSGSTYLGPEDVITVTDTNSGSADSHKWQYLSNGSWTDGGTLSSNGGTFNPFSNATLASAGTATVRVGATKSTTTVYNNDNGITYTYFTAPTVTKGNTTLSNNSNYQISKGETINFASTQQGVGTIQYKIDKYTNGVKTSTGTWTAATANSVVPFDDNSTDEYVELQVREVIGNNATSAVAGTFTLHRQPNLPTIVSSSGTNYLDADDTITLTNIDSNSTAYYAYAESDGYGKSWGDYSNDVSYTDFPTIAPFSGFEMNLTAGYKIKAKSKRNIPPAPAETDYNSDYTEESVFYYLTAPTVSKTGSSGTIDSSDNNNAGPILNADDTITLNHTNGFTGTIKYRVLTDGDVLLQDWTDYTTPFNPFINNGATKIKIEAKQYVSETTQSGVKTVTNIRLRPTEPTVSVADGTYLDNDDTVTITNSNPSATTTYDYSTDGGTTWTTGQSYNSAITPFSGKTNAYGRASYKIKVYSTRFDLTTGGTKVYTYNFLSTPTMDKKDNAELVQTDLVTVTKTSGTASGTTLQYSISTNNSTWDEWANCDANNQFAPFNVTGHQSNLILYVKVREKLSDGTISPESASVKLIKDISGDGYYVFYQDGNETSRTNYDSTGAFFITNTINSKYSGETVYYQATADGVAGSFAAYDITNGIPASTYANNDVVSFKFYVIEGGTTKIVAENIFTKNGVVTDDDTNMLVYQESFDGASISGTTFTTGSTRGLNGTLANSGTMSVISTYGAAYDKRNNVLKIEDPNNSSTHGNYMKMASNPLANAKNAQLAQSNGVTISFWKLRQLVNSGSDANWVDVINFTNYDSSTGNATYNHYAQINENARFYFNDGNGDQGGNYYDYEPWDNDITNHSDSVHSQFWQHVALTINPNPATGEYSVMMYINGEPHELRSTDMAQAYRNLGGSGPLDGNNYTQDKLAKLILEYLTKNDMSFFYAFNFESNAQKNGKELYIDDVRIYTKVKTQVEINNMYTDSLTDAYNAGVTYKSSTSHDPTNVTVYTLKSAVRTDNGTKAAGSQVGQEFIDYYDVPASNYDVTYYSFGTGLTVYKSTDNVNWTVVGDSRGRSGYQNQELFVSASGEAQPYTTTLSEPLTWAAKGTSRNNGDTRPGAAGKLVWAPHVMYNLSQDKWMYYGSTSAWQSSYSAVFLLTSDYVDHGYKYQQMIVKTHGNDHEEGSSSATNAIDSCVYYGHDATGKIDKTKLYCLIGSWGNIMVTSINADGTLAEVETDPDSWTLLSVARNGGEGGYMTYRKDAESSTGGYYYYYISPGHNGWSSSGGPYQIRVFRSENPTTGFVAYNGNAATTDSSHHGNVMMTGYELDGVNYKYTSVGHSSVYKVYNNYGEAVDVNAAHTREYSNSSLPVEDGQLSTRQIWLVGNVAIHNPVAYTNDGWPTAFPLQYDGTFSTQNKGQHGNVRTHFTAYDIEGVYSANVFPDDNNESGYAPNNETFNIIANDDNSGTLVNTSNGVGQYFELSYSEDNKTTYITLYTADENGSVTIDGTKYYVHAQGVIANQGTNGSATPEFSYIIKQSPYDQACQHVWGVKVKDYPRDEVNAPQGVMVEMDKVVYTHLANGAYEKYGQEISDNINYLSGTSGERITTFKVKYPYYVDTNDVNSIICLNDADFVAKGYSTGTYKLQLVGYYGSDGNALSTQSLDYYKNNGTDGYVYYKLTGNVSNYFAYGNGKDGGYPETGLQLLVRYTDGTHRYGEYKFPFVMPNPAMAHTIVGSRNTQHKTNADSRGGLAIFTRLDGSIGSASSYMPVAKDLNAGLSGTGAAEYFGTGNFNYLYEFPNSQESIQDSNYTGASNIKDSFSYYEASEGTNSGSFGLVEHYDDDLHADKKDPKPTFGIHTASANVVNADYYIDYSDEKNNLITRDNSGNPTGYTFDFFASNLYWSHPLNVYDCNAESDADDAGVHRATSFVKNGTGISMTSSVTPTTTHGLTDQKSKNHYYYLKTGTVIAADGNSFFTGLTTGNQWLLNNQGTTDNGSGNYKTILKTMTTDGTADYSKLTKAFTYADGGLTETAGWQGRLTFTGNKFSDVSKATGNTAETAHNFAFEEGFKKKVDWFNGYGVQSEETFHYYNIGVDTCDKGAVREFVDTWLNKEMTITKNANGRVISIAEKPVTTEGVTSTYINAANYTVASYNEYLDAIAEAYWFLNNPRNTHMRDYDSSKADTRYTTAYGKTPDGSTHAMIYTDEKGEDIFGENASTNHTDEVQAKIINNVITAYENLFNISNYEESENTYASIEFKNASGGDVDKETGNVSDVKNIVITENAGTQEATATTYSYDDYTADSWNNFVTLVKSVSANFDYYTEEAQKQERDKDFWRYVTLTGEEYNNLMKILGDADNSLMPVVDTASLTKNLTNKKGNNNSYEGTTLKTRLDGETEYSYSSWIDMYNEVANGDTALSGSTQKKTYIASDETEQQFTLGRYKVKGVTEYEFNDVEYYAQDFDSTEFTEDGNSDTTKYDDASVTNCSDIQKEVYDASAAIEAAELEEINQSTYESYDYAYALASSVDTEKYTDAGKSLINDRKGYRSGEYDSDIDYSNDNAKYFAYVTLNAGYVSDYNRYHSQNTISTSTLLKNMESADDATDYLLTALSEIETSYVRDLTATLTVVKDGVTITPSSSQTVKHGATFNFDLTTIKDGEDNSVITLDEDGNAEQAVTYSITKTKEGKAVGSRKWTFKGATISQLADADMAITATIVSPDADIPSGNTEKVFFYNAYGRLSNILYCTGVTYDNESGVLSALAGTDIPEGPIMPFYSFTNWVLDKNRSDIENHKYAFKAIYTAYEGESNEFTYTITGGTISGARENGEGGYTAALDTDITIKSNVENFYAWAAESPYAEGKYQIVSYTDNYTFKAFGNEKFVPVINAGTSKDPIYQIGGKTITASMLDCSTLISDNETINANDFVQQKLKAKEPFVSIVRVKIIKNYNTNDQGQYRHRFEASMRVTNGSVATTDVSLLYTKTASDSDFLKGAQSGVKVIKISNISSSGTFTVGANAVFANREGKIRGSVSYDYNYKGKTANLIDYTDVYELTYS